MKSRPTGCPSSSPFLMSRSNNKAVHPSIHVADLHRASRAAFIWIALRCQLASSTALHFTRVPGVSIFTYDSAAIVSVAWWASRGFVVFGLGWVGLHGVSGLRGGRLRVCVLAAGSNFGVVVVVVRLFVCLFVRCRRCRCRRSSSSLLCDRWSSPSFLTRCPSFSLLNRNLRFVRISCGASWDQRLRECRFGSRRGCVDARGT